MKSSTELIAGGNWNNAANCGSRSRNANNYRWNTNTNIGARFVADTGLRNELNSWLDFMALSPGAPEAKHIAEAVGGQ